MSLRVFNSLTSDKQEFVPLVPGRVGIYVCGITVYDLPHIGHARMLCAFDTAVRFLRWSGWDVKYVRNWTDVDDKIIRRANERDQDAAGARAALHRRMPHGHGLRSASCRPTSSPRRRITFLKCWSLIGRLIERGHAYAVGGDVYFAVRSFAQYGKLSKRNLDDP